MSESVYFDKSNLWIPGVLSLVLVVLTLIIDKLR